MDTLAVERLEGACPKPLGGAALLASFSSFAKDTKNSWRIERQRLQDREVVRGPWTHEAHWGECQRHGRNTTTRTQTNMARRETDKGGHRKVEPPPLPPAALVETSASASAAPLSDWTPPDDASPPSDVPEPSMASAVGETSGMFEWPGGATKSTYGLPTTRARHPSSRRAAGNACTDAEAT